jgi:hypothetical protein
MKFLGGCSLVVETSTRLGSGGTPVVRGGMNLALLVNLPAGVVQMGAMVSSSEGLLRWRNALHVTK